MRLEGYREADRALGQLPKRTGKASLRRALKKTIGIFVEVAKSLAPVLTGDLRLKIGAGTKLSRRQRRAMRGQRRSTVEIYAGPEASSKAIVQEFGSDDNPPQPYMRPAWDRTWRKMLDALKANIWADIRKTVERLARKAKRDAAKIGKR